MRFLDLTLPSPAENLALDEALLLDADRPLQEYQADTACNRSEMHSLLRVWSASRPVVVIGRSSRVNQEVNVEQAERLRVSILRRCSGGAAVVLGPGCLVYSLLLHLEAFPRLRMLDVAHRFVMDRMLQAVQPLSDKARFDGTCDLVISGKKFSGNSLRVGRNWMLYHGTILLDMDLSWIDHLLRHPPREPEYRSGRPHSQFVTNLMADSALVIQSIRQVWQAWQPPGKLPLDTIAGLVHDRYGNDAWNLSR